MNLCISFMPGSCTHVVQILSPRLGRTDREYVPEIASYMRAKGTCMMEKGGLGAPDRPFKFSMRCVADLFNPSVLSIVWLIDIG